MSVRSLVCCRAHLMKLLLSYLRPYWKLVLLALLLATVNQVFSLLDPLIFRHVIDEYATRFDQYSTGAVPARGDPAAPGRGRGRLRLPRRQELPGLLRQCRHPAARRAALLGRDPALARAALPALRGPAERGDPRQAPEGAHGRREARLGRHQRRLPDAGRRRLRRRLRLQRALADRARVLRHGAAARLALVGALAADQGRAEDDRGRDDGARGVDHGVAAQHRARQEHGPRRPGGGAPQRHHRPHPGPGAAEGALPAQPELHPGHGRQRAADVDPLPDAVPHLRAADHGRPVLRALDLLLLHLRAAAGARHRHQHLP